MAKQVFQVNVIFDGYIEYVVYNCLSKDAALSVKRHVVNAFFARKILDGFDCSDIFEKLDVQVVAQEG